MDRRLTMKYTKSTWDRAAERKAAGSLRGIAEGLCLFVFT
jgi:hypothetical protein